MLRIFIIVLAVLASLKMIWTLSFIYILLIGIFVASISAAVISSKNEKRKDAERFAKLTAEEQDSIRKEEELREIENKQRMIAYKEKMREQSEVSKYGLVDPILICPHCATIGQVRSTTKNREATIITNGILKSRATMKKQVTQRHCDRCQSTWDI